MLRKTRFKDENSTLCFENQGRNNWRFVIKERDGSEGNVGPMYASKDELLADLRRYALEYGFKD